MAYIGILKVNESSFKLGSNKVGLPQGTLPYLFQEKQLPHKIEINIAKDHYSSMKDNYNIIAY